MAYTNLQEFISNVLDHMRGMWRFRWWMLGISWALLIAGSLYVFSLPDTYRASARVFVDTNSLLRPLMEGLTARQNPMDEVQLVAKAVLTRPNLEQVAYTTDLDLRTKTPEEMEALVTGLQSQIAVTGGGDNIFLIAYQDESRDKAREVVAAVLDTFVETSIGNEGSDADVTERALAGEIAVHEKRLREAEAALARFKQDNLGYMPGEYGGYYERLQLALANVAHTRERIRLVTEKRDELRRQLEGEVPVIGIMPSSGSTSRCSQGAEIEKLKAQLSALRVDFTEKHPRVETLEDTIAYLQEQCTSEGEALGGGRSFSAQGGEPLEANPVYQNMRIQLSNAEVELVELSAQLNALENNVAGLRSDVDKITDVEAELKQLNRDYDVVQTRHQSLLGRWEDLQSKKRLDPVTESVQFRRIEPPFASAEPVAPNRPLLLVGVLLVAVAGGFATGYGLNQANPVFFSGSSLRRVTDIPVLGSISMVLTPKDIASRRREAIMWGACCLMLMLGTVVAVVFAAQAAALLRGLIGSGVV